MGKRADSFLAKSRKEANVTQEEWAGYMREAMDQETFTFQTVSRLERDPNSISLERLMAWYRGVPELGKSCIRRYLAEQFDI